MRIGFDFRPAQRANSRRRGVGRFTAELADSLLRLDSDQHRFHLYTIGEEQLKGWPKAEVRRTFHLARPSRLNWVLDELFLPRRIRRDRLDLFQATEITAIPRPSGCKVWATVHDMIPFVYWDETVKQVPRDFRIALERARDRISEVDRVITISEHARSDITRLLGISSEKVSVIQLGCTKQLYPVDILGARTALMKAYGVEGRFLLYVGGTDFRKNLPVLLEGFSILRDQGYPGKLVLVGETFGWDIPEVERLNQFADKLGIRQHLLFPGYVSDEGLRDFYAACDFFVFPSLYEGFGLPLLEAMTCGTPVLSSDRTSLPEVGGDCAFYFDPSDPRKLAEAFWEADADREGREIRRLRGLERAKLFSWDSAGQTLLNLYDQETGGSRLV